MSNFLPFHRQLISYKFGSCSYQLKHICTIKVLENAWSVLWFFITEDC